MQCTNGNQIAPQIRMLHRMHNELRGLVMNDMSHDTANVGRWREFKCNTRTTHRPRISAQVKTTPLRSPRLRQSTISVKGSVSSTYMTWQQSTSVSLACGYLASCSSGGWGGG